MFNKNKKQAYKNPERGGTVVYYEEGSYYYESDTLHSITVGGTSTGKTKRVIIPSMYTMIKNGDCFIANDTKKELYYTFKKYLTQKGYDVILIDYRNTEFGSRHNFMGDLNYYVKTGQLDEAQMEAEDLATTLIPTSRQQEPMWNEGAKSLITATMLAIALSNDIPDTAKNIVNVFYNITELGQQKGVEASKIDYYFEQDERTPIEKLSYGSYAMSDSKVRMSFNTIATTALRNFTRQKIANQSSVSDFDLRDYAKKDAKPVAVFVVNPEEKPSMELLANTFLEQCNRKLIEEANKLPGSSLPRRWFFVNDEFTNMGRLHNYEKRLTINRDRNICYIHGVQNISQINAVYGKDIAETILKNCRIKIWLEAAENEEVETLQKMTGSTAVIGSSTSRKTRGLFNLDTHNDSYNYSSKKVPLLSNDFLTNMKAPTALVKKAGMYAFTTELPFWQNTPLKDLLIMSNVNEEVARKDPDQESYLKLLVEKGIKSSDAANAQPTNDKEVKNDEEVPTYDPKGNWGGY